MFKKNQTLTVNITDMTNEGCGVCRVDDIVIFIIGGVTGDTCDIKIIKTAKNYAVAAIINIITPSCHRISSPCKNKRCGGCVFENITEKYELEVKRNIVESAFRKAGIEADVAEAVLGSSMCGYRNKAQFPVCEKEGKVSYGFYAQKTHTVINIEKCDLTPNIFNCIAESVCKFANEKKISTYNENTGKGVLRHIYLRRSGGKIVLTVVINSDGLPFCNEFTGYITGKYPDVSGIVLNINKDRTNVILGKTYKTVFGNEVLTDKLCGLEFEISPASFYQVNHDCCEALYNKAKELLDIQKEETAVDLYCGVGTVGLCVAKNAKRLIGIEIVPEAVENAKRNSLKNGIKNAEFYCGDSSIIKGLNITPDAIIVDPPRKGLSDEVISAILELSPKKLLYISCNPDTLARDVKSFSKDYEYSTVYPYNMFPRTGHVETVVLMSKVKG